MDDIQPEPIDAEIVEDPWRPWGFWATVGFSAIVVVAFVAIQTAVVIGFVVVLLSTRQRVVLDELVPLLEHNGLLLSTATCLAAPPCIALVALFAKLRRPASVRRYLALQDVPLMTLVGWLLLLVAFAACCDGLTILLGRPIVPPFMIETYRTAGFVPLLWIAFVVMAPLFEEVFFRGFVFEGIQHSRLGVCGAIVLTSFVWALCHTQYDVYLMMLIFASGILLGIARWHSKSLYPAVAMHAAMNLIATVQVAILDHGAGA